MPENQRIDNQEDAKERNPFGKTRQDAVIKNGDDNGGDITGDDGDELHGEIAAAGGGRGHGRQQHKAVCGNGQHDCPEEFVGALTIIEQRLADPRRSGLQADSGGGFW